MWIPILLFLVGLVLLIKGGDWFVDGATAIAHRSSFCKRKPKMPPFVERTAAFFIAPQSARTDLRAPRR